MKQYNIHATGVEIISDGYTALVRNHWANPVEYAKGNLDEVISEEDSVPVVITKAREYLEEGNIEGAKDLLEAFLEGTDYDPNND